MPPIGKKSKQPAFTTKAENNRLKIKPAGAASAEFAQRLLYLFKLSSVYCLFRFFCFTKVVYCSGESSSAASSSALFCGAVGIMPVVSFAEAVAFPASIPKFCPQKSASCILGISVRNCSYHFSSLFSSDSPLFCLLPNKHCFSEKTLSLHNFFRIQRFDSARFRPSVCIVCVKY